MTGGELWEVARGKQGSQLAASHWPGRLTTGSSPTTSPVGRAPFASCLSPHEGLIKQAFGNRSKGSPNVLHRGRCGWTGPCPSFLLIPQTITETGCAPADLACSVAGAQAFHKGLQTQAGPSARPQLPGDSQPWGPKAQGQEPHLRPLPLVSILAPHHFPGQECPMGAHQSSMGCGQMWLQTLLCHLLAVQLSFFLGKRGMLQALNEMTTLLLA